MASHKLLNAITKVHVKERNTERYRETKMKHKATNILDGRSDDRKKNAVQGNKQIHRSQSEWQELKNDKTTRNTKRE